MFRAIRRSGGGGGAGSGGRDGATRPRGCGLRQEGTVRLGRSVLARIRDGEPGWRGRINAALRATAGIEHENDAAQQKGISS